MTKCNNSNLECLKCINFDTINDLFTIECYECKRYYADKFEVKNDKVQ